jgi:hypothetical protein
VAIIGGEVHRFRPLIDMYRNAGLQAGYSLEDLLVGIHVPGYISKSIAQAKDEYFPGYQAIWTKMGRERGWPPVTQAQFEHGVSITGALFVGNAESIVEKIMYHNQSLGGISRLTFQMDMASLGQEKLIESIELIGEMKKILG